MNPLRLRRDAVPPQRLLVTRDASCDRRDSEFAADKLDLLVPQGQQMLRKDEARVIVVDPHQVELGAVRIVVNVAVQQNHRNTGIVEGLGDPGIDRYLLS